MEEYAVLRQTRHNETHVVLVGVISLLEGEDGGVEDAALLFQSVSLGGERQDGLVVGGQTRES